MGPPNFLAVPFPLYHFSLAERFTLHYSLAERFTLHYSLAKRFTIHFAHRAIGPCPIHEVVVMAVRKAVRAATITFTATSTIRFVFISYILHLPSYIIHQFCPKSPPPVLLLPPWFWLPPFSVDPFSPLPVDPFSFSGSSTSASSSLVTRFTSLPLRS